jgi:hypothetical protein
MQLVKRKAQGQPKQKAPKRQRVSLSMRAAGALGAAPVAYGQTSPAVGMRSDKPTRSGGEVRFLGCDYLGPVSTSTSAYVTTSYQVSPLGTAGNTAAFPRLSAVGSIFGKYAFNRLRYYVVGKAASTLAGDMTSAFVYEGGFNPLSVATEVSLKNRYGQATSKFWENHVMEVDCRKATIPWFINADDETAASDTNTFGYYFIGLEPTSSGVSAVADIFVEYDVEFCEAKAISDLQ